MNDLENKLEKIRRNCHGLNKLVTCLTIFFLIVIILNVINLTKIIFTPKDNFSAHFLTNGNLNISVENNKFFTIGDTIQPNMYPPNIDKLSYSAKSLHIFNLIMNFIMYLPVFYILFSLSRILSDILNVGKPFTQENIKLLKISSLLFFLYILYRPLYSFLSLIFVFGFDYYSYNVNINPTPAIFGFILLILAHVFDYGRLLQTQYDETV